MKGITITLHTVSDTHKTDVRRSVGPSLPGFEKEETTPLFGLVTKYTRGTPNLVKGSRH